MDKQMVAPSELHRTLEVAQVANEVARIDILTSILASGILAVIRRIPEIMLPLSGAEKVTVLEWAEAQTEEQDVSNRDFAFHLLVSCEVESASILNLLERNKTFSRRALEHIQKMLEGEGATGQLDVYLREVASTLLREERVRSRDRGRHIFMTLAKTPQDWLTLASNFSDRDFISDLRQGVLERFLYECPEGEALALFVDNVVTVFTAYIRDAKKEDVHTWASKMHWILMCLDRIEREAALMEAARFFLIKFGNALPHSVRYKCDYITQRAVEKLRPTQNGAATKLQIPQKPRSVEEALRDGWKIRKESGKQVLLVKDKTSVTLYRS